MKLVRPRFDNGIHDGPVATSEFRAVGVGLYLEFLQSLHWRLNYEVRFVEQVGQVRIIVHAIQQKIILQ
jgi:hypothetical protein